MAGGVDGVYTEHQYYKSNHSKQYWKRSFRIYYSLSGSGFTIPGFSIDLYSKLTGGSLIKNLYYESTYDLESVFLIQLILVE